MLGGSQFDKDYNPEFHKKVERETRKIKSLLKKAKLEDLDLCKAGYSVDTKGKIYYHKETYIGHLMKGHVRIDYDCSQISQISQALSGE